MFKTIYFDSIDKADFYFLNSICKIRNFKLFSLKIFVVLLLQSMYHQLSDQHTLQHNKKFRLLNIFYILYICLEISTSIDRLTKKTDRWKTIIENTWNVNDVVEYTQSILPGK